MKKRNKIVAVTSIAVGATAIVTGALMTSNAMASTPNPLKASVSVVASDPDGEGAISCQFDDVELPVGPTLSATASLSGPVTVEGSTATAGGPEGPSFHVEAGTAQSGTPGLEPPAGAPIVGGIHVSAVAGEQPPGLTAVAAAVGDGQPPAGLLELGDARPGTPEECAAFRPGTGPFPVPSAATPAPGISAQP
jgi:hypothetical protein